jgi:hypothetical protein
MTIPKERFRQLTAIKGPVALLALGGSLDKAASVQIVGRPLMAKERSVG